MLDRILSRTFSAALLFSFALAPLVLKAADAPSKVSVTAAAVPPQAPKIEKHDVLLMNLSIHDQLIITRMLPDGACRQYLRQSGGFTQVLPGTNKGNDFAATASPDGKWIAFYSSRTGAVNLWVCDAAGMNQRALTESDTSVAEFHPLDDAPIQFSNDSKSVAYIQSGNLWLSSIQGQNPRALTHEQGVEAFAWAPDGAHLAYVRFGSIRIVNVNGQPDELLAANASNYPTLSFNSDAKSNELFCFYNGVWKLNTSTKKRERVVGSFSFPNRVRSSPAGDSVAYLGFSSDVREEIFTVSPSKKTSTQITLGGASTPLYSRDGKWIYFKRKGGLWRINVQGEKAYSVYDSNVFLVQTGMLEFAAAAGACP